MTAPILTTSYNAEDQTIRASDACEQGWTFSNIGAGTNEIRRMLIGRELIGAQVRVC